MAKQLDKIIEKIEKLKKEKRAIILAHNYQLPEIQDIADFVGDSLGLSIKASKTDSNVIIFCGVYFMAETAKILSPQKRVFIPDKNAGCPMADMITKEGLIDLKNKFPSAKVLCYVNTPAEVKAECDICCTSANAIKIVEGPLKDEKEIIFVPDKYLAHYVSTKTNREFIYWNGYCPTHISIRREDIIAKKKLHPSAEVIVHPECTPEVIELADKVLSTDGMVNYVKESQNKEFIIGTEAGLLYRLKKESPHKFFYPAKDDIICSNMKKITLEKVLWTLESEQYEVLLDEDIIKRAQMSIRRMVDYSS